MSPVSPVLHTVITVKIYGNREILTQKTKEENFSPPLGFEPWSPGTENQCAILNQVSPLYSWEPLPGIRHHPLIPILALWLKAILVLGGFNNNKKIWLPTLFVGNFILE